MASIRQLTDNTYQVVVCLGYNRNQKVRKKKNFKIDKNLTPKQKEKAIRKLADDYEEKLKSGETSNKELKLIDFIDIWWEENVLHNTSPTTQKRYESLCIPIKEKLGYLKLNEISVLSVTRFKNYLSTTKSKVPIKNEEGEIIAYKPYSPKTQRHYWVTLSTILNYACELGFIQINPCGRVSAPKLVSHEANFLEEEEIKKMLDCLKKEPIKNRVMIESYLFTGARRGEIMGLEISDIDLKNGTIKIQRTSEYVTGMGIITKEPKTEKSKRTITIPDFLVKELKEYLVWYYQEKLKMGDLWVNSNRLFTKYDGSPMHPETPSQTFRKFLKKNNLPHIKLHELRHCYATILLNNAVDLKTISSMLGHSNIGITFSTYSHSLDKSKRKAADILEKTLIS